MKTTYRHDKKSDRRTYLVLAMIVMVGALLLYADPVREAFLHSVYTVAPRMWEMDAVVSDSANSFLNGFRNSEVLAAENKDLRSKMALMEALLLDRDLLASKLARYEGIAGQAKYGRMYANIVAGEGRSPYGTLIIDRGLDGGVSEGDLVVYAGMGVIGKIAEVYPTSSKVILLSAPGEETTVVIGEYAIPTVVHGRGMGNFEAKVPQGSGIVAGDNVLLPGGEFIVGVVGAVEERPTTPFSRVLLRIPFNTAVFGSVEVLVNKRAL